MNWKVPKIWDGGDAWIIGGGPSVPRQFDVPEHIIQKVINGTLPPSAYSPYMALIHNEHVIGVNMAYKIGPWIDIVMFGDSGFFAKERAGLSQFPGLKISCNPTSKSERWVKTLNRDGQKSRGVSENPTMVSWNGNTGAAAINLAVHLGASKIFLLGFDMDIDPKNNMQHWHNLYSKGPVAPHDDRRRRKLPFGRHLQGFPVIAEDIKKRGVQIINVSPESTITCFPKMTIKQIFDERR